MAKLTLNIGLNSFPNVNTAPAKLGDRERIYDNELLVQLCTDDDTFDGEYKWDKGGMAYILRTRGNRLVIIDGGRCIEDSLHLIKKAKELTDEERPTVALWIITHPHVDHYNALLFISRDVELKNALNVERLCFQLPESPIPATGMKWSGVRKEVLEIAENLKDCAEIVTPHTGNVWEIDGMTVRFFFTPEDFDALKDSNEFSLIFQVQGTEKTVMFTGDAYPRTAARVALRFWDELKSDVCQLAHHGLNGADASFYARVDAKTVLIPICKAGDDAMNRPIAGILPRFYAERNAERVIKAYEGDNSIEL